MKITKRQLRRIIKEELKSASPTSGVEINGSGLYGGETLGVTPGRLNRYGDFEETGPAIEWDQEEPTHPDSVNSIKKALSLYHNAKIISDPSELVGDYFGADFSAWVESFITIHGTPRGKY